MNFSRKHGNGRLNQCGECELKTLPVPFDVIASEMELESNLQQVLQPDDQWMAIYVEDNIDDAMFAKNILLESPMIDRVYTVPDAPTLFSLLKSENVYHNNAKKSHCLLVIDINLPGKNGLDLLKTIKGCPLTDSMPVIIITGDTDLNKVYESYAASANGYIHKPLKPENLDDIHEVLCSGSSWKRKGQGN